MTSQLSLWSRVPLLQTSSTPVQARMRIAALGRSGALSAGSVPMNAIDQFFCVTSTKQGLSPARQFLTGLQLIRLVNAVVEAQRPIAAKDETTMIFFIEVVLFPD